MALFIVLGLIVIVATFVFARRLGIESAEKWAGYAQSVATIVGIAAAAYLFLVERRNQPHADVSQEVTVVPLDAKSVAVEAHVLVKNLGNQLITLNHLNTRLQAANLRLAGLQHLPLAARSAYWNATATIGGERDQAFDETELRWPQLRLYDGPIHHEVEPGETDVIVATFVVPCSIAQTTSHLRIATDVRKEQSTAEAMAWKARTFVEIGPACSEAKK